MSPFIIFRFNTLKKKQIMINKKYILISIYFLCILKVNAQDQNKVDLIKSGLSKIDNNIL